MEIAFGGEKQKLNKIHIFYSFFFLNSNLYVFYVFP